VAAIRVIVMIVIIAGDFRLFGFRYALRRWCLRQAQCHARRD